MHVEAVPDYTSEIAALEAAYASGALQVTVDGQSIRFASAGDLLARINRLRDLDDTASSARPRSMSVNLSGALG